MDNTLDKYLLEVSLTMSDRMEWTEDDDTPRMDHALKRLFEAGTDPLALTIEACRAQGTAILASYRMNDLPAERVAEMMGRHRDEICHAALRCFEEGADGISTYNFFGHSLYSPLARKKGFPACTHPSPRRDKQYRSSLANARTELFAHSFLSSPETIQQCLRARPEAGDGRCEWQPV